jgi:hypothetical protein
VPWSVSACVHEEMHMQGSKGPIVTWQHLTPPSSSFPSLCCPGQGPAPHPLQLPTYLQNSSRIQAAAAALCATAKQSAAASGASTPWHLNSARAAF